MRRFVIPVRTHLDYVESRGWLLGKLGIGVLVIAGAVFLWGPLVAGRPHAERLAGWLAWAAIALVALGVVVRVAEAIWGMACIAYVLVRSLVMATVSSAWAILRGIRSLGRALRRLVPVLAIVLFLGAVLAVLATACTSNAAREALASLKSDTVSPKYHSGFWANEASKPTDLWKQAQQLCRAQEASPTPNCRVVFVVAVTVRSIAVPQSEDRGDPQEAWIRAGTRELGLPTPDSMPPPAEGFGPKPPKMPPFPGR